MRLTIGYLRSNLSDGRTGGVLTIVSLYKKRSLLELRLSPMNWMPVVWDDRKGGQNLLKHKVSFWRPARL
jgi:hypothetical protein